jgi:ABC-type tungstate transport system substrate-binding protein
MSPLIIVFLLMGGVYPGISRVLMSVAEALEGGGAVQGFTRVIATGLAVDFVAPAGRAQWAFSWDN